MMLAHWEELSVATPVQWGGVIEFALVGVIRPSAIKRPLFTGIFFVRLAIVCFGLLVAALGWYAWIHGNFWFAAFNPRFGQFGTGPTVMLVLFGILIIFFGLFSPGWEEITPDERKQFARNWWKSRGNTKRLRNR
jgi:hypothetical protein